MDQPQKKRGPKHDEKILKSINTHNGTRDGLSGMSSTRAGVFCLDAHNDGPAKKKHKIMAVFEGLTLKFLKKT